MDHGLAGGGVQRRLGQVLHGGERRKFLMFGEFEPGVVREHIFCLTKTTFRHSRAKRFHLTEYEQDR